MSSINKRSSRMWILKKLHKKPSSQVTQNIPKLGCCCLFNKCEFCFILEEEEEEATMVSLCLDRCCRRRRHICNLRPDPASSEKDRARVRSPKTELLEKQLFRIFFPRTKNFGEKKVRRRRFGFGRRWIGPITAEAIN